jgi:hypothetical protein
VGACWRLPGNNLRYIIRQFLNSRVFLNPNSRRPTKATIVNRYNSKAMLDDKLLETKPMR